MTLASHMGHMGIVTGSINRSIFIEMRSLPIPMVEIQLSRSLFRYEVPTTRMASSIPIACGCFDTPIDGLDLE